MNARSSTVFLLLLLLISKTDCARILGLLITPSVSHHIWNGALMQELVQRGHHVTVVSPDSPTIKHENYRHIIIEGVYDELYEVYNYNDMVKSGLYENTMDFFQWGQFACEVSLKTRGAEQLKELVGTETFDLIIVESVLEECFYAFIPLFGSPPTIAISAYASPPWANEMVSNPLNPSYINSYLLPYTDRMTLFQRLSNFLLQNFALIYRTYWHLPAQDRIVRKYLGPELPEVSVLERNVSMVFTNIDSRLDFPRPFVPAMIPVGGMHIKPSKPLPKDIQQFLDEATQGAVFFSLGSNLRSDKLPPEIVSAFLEVFRELPQRVLWKWESESLPHQPPNVKVSKWLPQNDILGHPHVIAFISHGGMLSVQEASYHGVPVIGIPFLADQLVNMHKTVARGMGVLLDFQTLSKETISSALKEVLHERRYLERAAEVSNIFRDQPQTPLERAAFWTEYVLRHNGAHHLRSAALDLSWYQLWMLDVLLLLLLAVIFVVLVLFVLCRALMRLGRRVIPQQQKKTQ